MLLKMTIMRKVKLRWAFNKYIASGVVCLLATCVFSLSGAKPLVRADGSNCKDVQIIFARGSGARLSEGVADRFF